METLSIDRIDEKLAICEDNDGNVHTICIDKLPNKVREGDIIKITDNGNIVYDEQETNKRKAEVRKLIDRIVNKK